MKSRTFHDRTQIRRSWRVATPSLFKAQKLSSNLQILRANINDSYVIFAFLLLTPFAQFPFFFLQPFPTPVSAWLADMSHYALLGSSPSTKTVPAENLAVPRLYNKVSASPHMSNTLWLNLLTHDQN